MVSDTSDNASKQEEPSLDLDMVSRYFAHGLVFYFLMVLSNFILVLLFVVVIVLLSLAGIFVWLGVAFLVWGHINGLLCDRIWHFKVRVHWMSQVGQGFVMFIILLVSEAPVLVLGIGLGMTGVPLVVPLAIEITAYSFLYGAVGKAVGIRFVEPQEGLEAELAEEEVQVGKLFFAPPERPWNVIAAILAIVIFVVWTSRSGLEPLVSTFVAGTYAVLALASTRFKHSAITLEESPEYIVLKLSRSGVCWRYLVYAILGSAIPLLLPWFVLNNSVLNSPLPAQSIMIFAMVVYIMIIPILPTLSFIPRLPILKTTLSLSYNPSVQQVADVQLNVNPLDGYWYDHRNDIDLRSQVESSALEYITQHLEIKSSQVSRITRGVSNV
jgi:hypothetical protein